MQHHHHPQRQADAFPTIYTAQVDQLVSMGFARDVAAAAITEARGDVNQALNSLVQQ